MLLQQPLTWHQESLANAMEDIIVFLGQLLCTSTDQVNADHVCRLDQITWVSPTFGEMSINHSSNRNNRGALIENILSNVFLLDSSVSFRPEAVVLANETILLFEQIRQYFYDFPFSQPCSKRGLFYKCPSSSSRN
jgi:hypothetical protein